MQEISALGDELYLFTAATKDYALPIVTGIERVSGVSFHNKFYREDCEVRDGKLIKPIDQKVGAQDWVVVDDSELVRQTHPSNTLVVSRWEGDHQDRELRTVLASLEVRRALLEMR